MSVRDQDRFDAPVGDCIQIRQRILPGVLRMHSAIEHQPVTADLKIVRVRADLRAASEINEFQATLLLLLLLMRKRVRPRLFADTSGQTADQPHQHRNNLKQLLLPGPHGCLVR